MAILGWNFNIVTPRVATFAPLTSMAQEEMLDLTTEQVVRGHRWHATLTWARTTVAQMALIRGHFLRAADRIHSLEVPMFDYLAWLGTRTADTGIKFDGAQAAGLSSIAITGGTGAYWTGDRFNTGHPYAYEIRRGEEDLGAGNISIWPPLVAAVIDQQALFGEPETPTTLVKDNMEIVGPLSFPQLASGGIYGEFLVELRSVR